MFKENLPKRVPLLDFGPKNTPIWAAHTSTCYVTPSPGYWASSRISVMSGIGIYSVSILCLIVL